MEKIIQGIYDLVWSPALILLLVGAGLYFTFRTRCAQVRLLPEMTRLLFGKRNSKEGGKGISSFEAFCISLSGRVGTGNVVGVATAIALGGPGSVFWMWVIAFFGASTAFVESTLAQKYKYVHNGQFRGGPYSYIEKALGQRWLAIIFAVLCVLGYGLLMVSVQANSMAMAFNNSFGITPLWTALAVTFLMFLVIVGGMKRIASFASIVTPFMAVGYVLFSLVILAVNWRMVPGAFSLIFKSAFGAGPIFGGMIGSAILMGVKRGLFSNEAGQGGGAIVAASADVKYPAQQGLAQAFSVYVDTLLVCTATALMILCTGSYNVYDAVGNTVVENAPELGRNYVAFTQNAVDTIISGVGNAFVSIALVFFAFTTMLAYYFYSESSILFLFGRNRQGSKAESVMLWAYRISFFGIIILGSLLTADNVWTLGDIGTGITTWVNVIVLLILSPQAIKCLKDYEAVMKTFKPRKDRL